MKQKFQVIVIILILSNFISCGSTSMEVETQVLDNEIYKVIDKLYNSISYQKDEKLPDWNGMKECFLEDAQMVEVSEEGKTSYEVDHYIDLYRNNIDADNYILVEEYGLSDLGDSFGNIAHVYSSYYTRVILVNGDTIEKRGLNSIQLVKFQNKWKISSIIWYDEDTNNRLPSKFLNPTDEE